MLVYCGQWVGCGTLGWAGGGEGAVTEAEGSNGKMEERIRESKIPAVAKPAVFSSVFGVWSLCPPALHPPPSHPYKFNIFKRSNKGLMR